MFEKIEEKSTEVVENKPENQQKQQKQLNTAQKQRSSD